jgi:hypothetical protein
MRVAVTCPYCKRPMAASSAFAGQMVACPNCRGEFLFAPPGMTPSATEAAYFAPAGTDGPPSIHTAATALAPAPPLAGTTYSMPAPPPKLELTAPPIAEATGVDAGVNRRAAPAPPQPPPQKARMKAATSQSPAALAGADGKLPTLQLADADRESSKSEGGQGIPLWLAVGAVAASTIMSAFLLLGDLEGTQSAAARTASARQDIVQFYGAEAATLAPYQILLREAQQAHSRGDLKLERQKYQRVLTLLRAEGRTEYDGLTGTPSGDAELAKLLSILLAD